MEPQQHCFADDGWMPNGRLPLLIYKEAFADCGRAGVGKDDYHH